MIDEISFFILYIVPPGQTLYTKQKCKNDGLNGACFDLVNAAGAAEVKHEIISFFLKNIPRFLKGRVGECCLIFFLSGKNYLNSIKFKL